MNETSRIKLADAARIMYNTALTFFNKWQPPKNLYGSEMPTPLSWNRETWREKAEELAKKIAALRAECDKDTARATRDFGTGSNAISYARLAEHTLAKAMND